VVIFTTRRAGA